VTVEVFPLSTLLSTLLQDAIGLRWDPVPKGAENELTQVGGVEILSWCRGRAVARS
jgi:hypothetical protein